MMRIILVFLCLCSLVWSEDAPKRLSLSNESVAVFVTNTESEKGRFAIETTGGDPSRDTDNNQPLIYGRPVPWTSYTTLRIDGKSYVFGGKSSKRMASGVGYGVVKKQIQNDSEIITVTDFDGIEVMQILSFLRNPMSRVKDMIHIEYVVTNKRSKSHQLGLRLMLDTMLGKNDGAPFRLKQHSYQSEQSFSGDSLAPFWQAFDALNAPTVIAQGLLTDPRLNLTTPDRVLLSNWGLLTDNAWTIKYKEGRSFVREGELELDTALALYWNERTLAPSESVRFRSAYGLGVWL